MNDRAKQELDKIVSVLAATGVVSQIYLFGSYARGEETPDSDIDLCVLTPEQDDDGGRRLTKITVDLHMKLFDVQEKALDLLTYNQDDFFTRAKHPRSFQRHIVETGVMLYGFGGMFRIRYVCYANTLSLRKEIFKRGNGYCAKRRQNHHGLHNGETERGGVLRRIVKPQNLDPMFIMRPATMPIFCATPGFDVCAVSNIDTARYHFDTCGFRGAI